MNEVEKKSYYVMPRGITVESKESSYEKGERRAKELAKYYKRTSEDAKRKGFYKEVKLIDEVLKNEGEEV